MEEDRKKRETEQKKNEEKETRKKEVNQKRLDESEQNNQENKHRVKNEEDRTDKEERTSKDKETNGFEVFEAETEIEMRNKKKNLFYKRSEILKSSIEKTPFYLNHNDLIEQISSLKYEKHYLLFVLSFRVLVEDITKKYLINFNKNLKSGLGENVSTMIDDILETTKKLDKSRQVILYNMLGGFHQYSNHLKFIKDEFYKNNEQGSLSNLLNSLTHTPRRIEEVDALNIANNIISPLIVVSEKLIELTSDDV